MKIIVTDTDANDWTYEGNDIYPLVDERTERLDILDHKGRPLAGFPRSLWSAFNVEYDNNDGETITKQDLADWAENWRTTVANRAPVMIGAPAILDHLEKVFLSEAEESDEDNTEDDGPSIGTAYIDVKPRFDFASLTVEEVSAMINKINSSVEGVELTVRRT